MKARERTGGQVSGIRVVIADDDDGVRTALHDVLDADERFLVVGTASGGDDLTRIVEAARPDVVLLDVRMPGGGEAAARDISALANAPVVVAVSASTEVTTVVAMLEAGATGYLAKGRLGQWLPEMVARCVDGQVVLAVPNGAAVLRRLGSSALDSAPRMHAAQ
jgi:two-component system nitrate/nitrite response regulator NarL